MSGRIIKEFPALYKGVGRVRKRLLITAVFVFLCAFSGKSINYYVSNSGNDTNEGTTPETAWKSIRKVNTYKFSPGDRILFERGDEWREQLTIPSSGASGSPITFSSYGTGDRPIINGSESVNSWTGGPSLWQTVVTADPKIVTISDTLADEALSYGALDAEGEWYWINGTLYVYSSAEPVNVEYGVRDYGITDGSDETNIAISNIEVKGTIRAGIAFIGDSNIPNSGIDISNCYVHHTRLMGFWFYDYAGGSVTDSRAEYTGAGFYCSPNSNYTVFARDTAMYNIHYVNGVNTNGQYQDGHGFGIEESDSCIIEYCYAFENGDGAFVVDNNYVNNYDAILRYNKALGSRGTEGVTNNNYGFGLARIGAGSTVLMHHNISYDYGRGFNSNLFVQTTEACTLNIYNNTFVNPSDPDGDVIRWYETSSADVDFRNNIVVGYRNSGSGYQLHDVTSNDFTYSDYNLFYGPDLGQPFGMVDTKYADLDAWNTATGLDANSVEDNPDFTSEFTDFSLQVGSPAINAGADVGLTEDILGNPIVERPDIGACEQQIKYTIEDISICEGSSYQGWIVTGQYQRTLTAASNADSIVTTNLIVNPVYHVSENITIMEGENYNGWTEAGEYIRKLSSVTGCDSTVTIRLSVKQLQHQSIHLEKGWNIFSSRLVPVNKNINDVLAILQQENLLIAVQEEAGNTLKKEGDEWIDNIGELISSEGYKIKVQTAVDFEISGYPVNLPLNIQLTAGWNIISFPYNGTVDALEVLQPLIEAGILEKVLDEKGNSIENWGSSVGWINGIGNFVTGEGYLIQVSQKGILPILENYEKSTQLAVNNIPPVYFSMDYEGNGSGHINIYIRNLRQSGLIVGDELAAYDGEICVGAKKLSEFHINNNAMSIAASVSDENMLNGFMEGNPIEISVWYRNKNEAIETPSKAIEGKMIYSRYGSVLVDLMNMKTAAIDSVKSFGDVKIYPNPARNKVTISFSQQPEPGTQLILTDLTGRQLMIQKAQSTLEVFDVHSLPAGIYLVITVSGDNRRGHKLIIEKHRG